MMQQWKIVAAAWAVFAVSAADPVARVGASAGTLASDSATAGVLVDRVVATVEDRAILKSEVDNALKRYLLEAKRTSIPAEEEKALKREVLNSLVADALLAIQAEKDNITVQETEVDAAVARAIEEKKTALGGDDTFERQLAAEGLTIEGVRAMYREPIRTRLLINAFIQEKVGPDIRVKEEDVQEYYDAHVAELPMRPATATMAHILIVPKASKAVLAKAFEKITAIEGKLKAGGDFATLAQESSDCPSAKFGGSLGTLKLDDLNNPPFAEAARKLPVGQISAPVLTEFGYHLIKIEGVEGDQVTLRHILVRAEATPEDVTAAAALAERVRTEIVAGADFAKEASQYSDDYATKDAGGAIGEVPLENLPDHFKEVIQDVPSGGLTPVMKEDRGFRIVKILSRNEARPYTLDEAKDELRRILEGQKAEERISSYIQELKKNYSVVIRGE